MQNDKRVKQPSRPLPEAIRERFFMAVWELAWSGKFHRYVPNQIPFFVPMGRGTVTTRRQALSILWLTALAGRFNELASLRVTDVDCVTREVRIYRSKGGKSHTILVHQNLIRCTQAWHARLALEKNYEQISPYLFPSRNGGKLNRNVFNRDVTGPYGLAFGCRLSSHSFRDTACQMAMNKVAEDSTLDVRAVQAFMGHRSMSTTEHYLRKQTQAGMQLDLYTGEED